MPACACEIWITVLTTVAKVALPIRASALRIESRLCAGAMESKRAEAVMHGCLEGRNLLHTCDGVCTARTATGSLLATAAVAIAKRCFANFLC